MKRKLASVQLIKDIKPINGADKIEKARVEGYNVIVPKNMYSENEKIVFFEADSFLPIEDRYSFLKDSSYKNDKTLGEGFRIRVVTMRGEVAHGLVMPISEFKEIENPEVGMDVTDLLNVKKWVREEIVSSLCVSKKEKPYFVPTIDELRVQSIECLIDELKNKPYYISDKVDGTSISMYYVDEKFGATTRKLDIDINEKGLVSNYVKKYDLERKIKEIAEKNNAGVVIQGEFAGPKIQGNTMELSEYKWFVFNIFLVKDSKCEQVDLNSMLSYTHEMGLQTVPIIEIASAFNYNTKELVERAKGNYMKLDKNNDIIKGHIREGIVVRPTEPIYSETLQKNLSFKVLNDEYWAKEN